MPIHDWTRAHAGTFHAFHNAWNTHLIGTLNGGLLPAGYYPLAEQIATRMQNDGLTLQRPVPLETTYQMFSHDLPAFWGEELEAPSPATSTGGGNGKA